MRRLGELENAVMALLWDAEEPRSVRDIVDALTEHRPLAYTTVMTVLDRLHDKGLVHRTRRGRAHFYRPAAPRETYVAALIEDALADTPDRAAALAHFAGRLSLDEATELRRLLRRKPRRGSG